MNSWGRGQDIGPCLKCTQCNAVFMTFKWAFEHYKETAHRVVQLRNQGW